MILSLTQADLIGGAVGFAFTIALLSYLIGDNPLYRVALHLFVGVAAGYAGLVVIFQVLTPRFFAPMTGGFQPQSLALLAVPLILFVFLILKLSPRTAALGNIGIAYLIGVGVAVAVGGAVTGTLFPQISMTWGANLPLFNRLVIVAGAVTTLMYFQFWLRGETATGGAERAAPMRVLADVGKGFMVITLGAIYGGMILSGIAVFSERVTTLYGWVQGLIH